mmetsp:Transcript_13501/g.27918  ORF Transcript_13501/g.27918 Transcript_13501/m.27918 type:complete len:121 (-) Transcript_13501:189-551(-)
MATLTPTSSPTTESTTTSPTPVPTFSPTSITLIESEEPTTERLRDALSDTIFLHDSDLTLKTTGIVEDVGNSTDGRLQTTPDMSNEILPEMSSARYPSSSKTTGVLLSALFGAFYVFALI